ncbi:MAG: hypothetical protein ABSB24_16435 [Gaiellaceae bacterium]
MDAAASVAGRRRELGCLLANDPHLLAIVLVGGYPADLHAERRAGPPTRCG